MKIVVNNCKTSLDVVTFRGVQKDRSVIQNAELVFVGYGINAPELKWNDYAGANVRNKWVMIMVNDPPAPADEPTIESWQKGAAHVDREDPVEVVRRDLPVE